MSKRLFVVVSTGQNVANLPPLLEHAVPGDQVVWVESAEARRAFLSRGARSVLTRLGLERLPDIEIEEVDDLEALVARSEPTVRLARERGLRPHLILNGGQKLTPLGLLRAWGELDPVLLYGQDRPAVCRTFPSTLNRAAEVRPYTKPTLDLLEILEVREYQVFNNQQSRNQVLAWSARGRRGQSVRCRGRRNS